MNESIDLPAGLEVDRYTIEGLLGRGGMATVYRVRHNQLGTWHALKVLSIANQRIQRRLLQEGRVQAALRHLDLVGEVITTPFTFPATVHAIAWNGLTPIFCDVDPETWNLDPVCARELVSDRTSALVHLVSLDGLDVERTLLPRAPPTWTDVRSFVRSRRGPKAHFEFEDVPVGRYKISVHSLDGYPYEPESVTVEAPAEDLVFRRVDFVYGNRAQFSNYWQAELTIRSSQATAIAIPRPGRTGRGAEALTSIQPRPTVPTEHQPQPLSSHIPDHDFRLGPAKFARQPNLEAGQRQVDAHRTCPLSHPGLARAHRRISTSQ